MIRLSSNHLPFDRVTGLGTLVTQPTGALTAVKHVPRLAFFATVEPAYLTPIKDRAAASLILAWNSIREAAMTYKTILVHCTDERRLTNLLGPAIAVARRCEAHLTAFSVLPPVLVDPALTPGGVVTIIDGHRKVYEKEQARMRAIFEEAIRGAGISAEWLTADADRGNVWSKVVDYGRSADLIVAPQADPTWSFSALVEAPAELVLHSGRPVLFIPNVGNHANFGSRALVAWNGRRESARAASDAVPLLKLADEVTVLWINPEQDKKAEDVPGADLCTSLARHGVKCEAATIERPEQSDGETLLARARHIHADLLVMGCYGHSRLREFILGGATKTVLKDMSIPVLMSH